MNTNISIKPFSLIYTEAVANLILGIQIGEFNVPITRQDQPDLDNIPAVYQQKNGNFWVALHEGQVVGTIAAIDFDDDRLALRKMFVHQDFRGKEHGTAQMLWETLLEWSTERQVRYIYLGTIERLIAARRFYARNGFEEVSKKELPENFPLMAVDTLFYKKAM
jgi:N-acetylglutamate synthase-like GNAT family acetyltransferase